MANEEAYLKAILATIARQTFAPEKIVEIIGANAGEVYRKAFNMCDGSRGQTEIARELEIDPGNFSRSVNRWIGQGILIRINDGNRSGNPLHVYPLPEEYIK